MESIAKTNSSSHVAWLDLGLFRNYPADGQCFSLGLPPGFNQSCVAMNEVQEPAISVAPGSKVS